VCAFEGSNPSIAKVLQVVRDEAAAWRLAGASSLSALWPLWPPVPWFRGCLVTPN
jgi:hypothetical protein